LTSKSGMPSPLMSANCLVVRDELCRWVAEKLTLKKTKSRLTVSVAMSRSLLNLGDGRGGDHYAAFDFDATGAMVFSCCASARMS
jgi:hypothetical protein